ALAGARKDRLLDEPAVPTGVATAGDAEHAVPGAHALHPAGLRPDTGVGRRVLGVVGHRMRPFSSEVGIAARASVSRCSTARRAFGPRGLCLTWSCSFRIASMSIS